MLTSDNGHRETTQGSCFPAALRALPAASCRGAVAFSFGCGIACFVAFFALLAMRRAGRRERVTLACGLLVAQPSLRGAADRRKALGIAGWRQPMHLLQCWPAFRLSDTVAARLLLVDRDGVARGLVMRDATHGEAWIGWMQGTGSGRAAPTPVPAPPR